MPRYSIRELEQLSSVKAHTIRIWEQRYNLLQPERTDTNIRYYNDEQLKRLLNVSVLMNNGMKISNISRLNNNQLSAEIEKLINDSKNPDSRIEAVISQAIIAITTFDEALFEKTINSFMVNDGLVNSYINIIHPLLVRTGQLWSSNEMLPAQEHFLSNLLEKKFYSAIDALPQPVNTDQTWILFLTEPEEHVLGLLLAYYILRKYGKKVIYLGRRVPEENLYTVIKDCKPTHLYTFFVKNHPVEETAALLTQFTKYSRKLNIYISGRQDVIENISLNAQVSWLKKVEDLIELVKK